MSYDIDSIAVNTRIDWRQQPTYPGLTDRSAETFPGDAALYLSIGEQLPAGVVITGFIEADTIALLKSSLDAQAALMASTALHTVSLNTATYNNQHLARFEILSGNIPFYDPDSASFKQSRRVRYVWQGVKP